MTHDGRQRRPGQSLVAGLIQQPLHRRCRALGGVVGSHPAQFLVQCLFVLVLLVVVSVGSQVIVGDGQVLPAQRAHLLLPAVRPRLPARVQFPQVVQGYDQPRQPTQRTRWPAKADLQATGGVGQFLRQGNDEGTLQIILVHDVPPSPDGALAGGFLLRQWVGGHQYPILVHVQFISQ
jgi:hypothetical protein